MNYWRTLHPAVQAVHVIGFYVTALAVVLLS